MILIPCKDLGSGKSRLAPVLSGPERRALCEEFLRLSLMRACELKTSAGVRLVTADSTAKEIAARYDVASIHDEYETLNEGLRAAAIEVAAHDVRASVVVMPIDLPLASTKALRPLLQTDADVLLVPDRNGEGTNLLAVSHAALSHFPFLFGPNSFALHLRSAQQLGLASVILRDPELGFDIDEPGDYREWRERASAAA